MKILSANCTPELCHNGGTCIPVADDSEQLCHCPEGFQGSLCQYGNSLLTVTIFTTTIYIFSV